jgi:hypothetical protein
MKVDIRVDADFICHPKTQRLIREMGDKVVASLLSLWGYIAMVARWDGDPKQFVDALVRLGWLKKQGKTYSIHEWEIHQTYVFFAEERSQAARKAAETRWKKQRGDGAGRMREACGAHAPDPVPSPVPSPSPDPFPPPGTGTDGGNGSGVDEAPAPAAPAFSPIQIRGLISGIVSDVKYGLTTAAEGRKMLMGEGVDEKVINKYLPCKDEG